MSHKPTTVVFDIGGVLLDWNPRYLYRKLFDDEAAMEHFLTHICSQTWNLLQDAGRSFAEAVAELSARYPEHRELIEAYHQRWEEMIPSAIDDTVAVLQTLKDRNTPLYAITNFSQEKFALCQQRFDFLGLFQGIVVSAEVRLIKPDPAIYLRLLDNYALAAEDCVFIDDSEINVNAARGIGMHAIHFTSPAQLGTELKGLKLL